MGHNNNQNSPARVASNADLVVGAAILCTLSQNAYAYIDPSAMILGLQALLATVVSVVIWIGKPIQRIKARFKLSKKDRARS